MRILVLLGSVLALCGCGVNGYGNSGGLVGTASPPNPYAANAEPQVPNSLPPFAQGLGNSGPNTRFPDFGAFTVGTPF